MPPSAYSPPRGLPPMMFNQRFLPVLSIALAAALFLPSVTRSFGDGTSWSVSDLHISYAAGFIRRGLLGELALWLYETFGLSTAVLFPALFVALTAAQIALQAALAWPLRARPALFILVMLAPALILFPAYDYGGYMRKEAFITIGLFAHAILVRRVLRGTMVPPSYERFLYVVLGPYLALSTLIHENQAIFLPAHALLIYMAGGYPKALASHIARVQVPVLLPATICFIAAIIRHGNLEMAGAICASWQGRAETACDAIGFLAHGYDQVWVYLVQVANSPTALGIYAATIILALVPPFIVRRALPAEGQAPLPLFLAATLPSLALFLLGWDIGRWIHMISVGLIALILAGAVRDLAPKRVGRMAAVAAMILTLAYSMNWRVNVCCLPTSLSGGMAHVLASAVPAVLGAR
jgi:hypothetical protein